jgi:hypothetical protein
MSNEQQAMATERWPVSLYWSWLACDRPGGALLPVVPNLSLSELIVDKNEVIAGQKIIVVFGWHPPLHPGRPSTARRAKMGAIDDGFEALLEPFYNGKKLTDPISTKEDKYQLLPAFLKVKGASGGSGSLELDYSRGGARR